MTIRFFTGWCRCVYESHQDTDALKTVEAFQPNEYYWLVCGQLVHRDDIRSANVAELDAGKRLGGRVWNQLLHNYLSLNALNIANPRKLIHKLPTVMFVRWRWILLQFWIGIFTNWRVPHEYNHSMIKLIEAMNDQPILRLTSITCSLGAALMVRSCCHNWCTDITNQGQWWVDF